MCKMRINNLSCLTETAALLRVVSYMSNDLEAALLDADGTQVVVIRHSILSYGPHEYSVIDFRPGVTRPEDTYAVLSLYHRD